MAFRSVGQGRVAEDEEEEEEKGEDEEDGKDEEGEKGEKGEKDEKDKEEEEKEEAYSSRMKLPTERPPQLMPPIRLPARLLLSRLCWSRMEMGREWNEVPSAREPWRPLANSLPRRSRLLPGNEGCRSAWLLV